MSCTDVKVVHSKKNIKITYRIIASLASISAIKMTIASPVSLNPSSFSLFLSQLPPEPDLLAYYIRFYYAKHHLFISIQIDKPLKFVYDETIKFF